MNRDLRQPLKAHLFDGSAGVCDLVFQGDFGKGVQTGGGLYSEPGANPYNLYGPVAPGANTVMVAGGGVPMVQFRVGTIVQGSEETEWVFCRWATGATPPDLKPGMMWQIDENYTASLTNGTNRALGSQIGVSMVFQVATNAVTGVVNIQANSTYFLWLARAGRLACYMGGGNAPASAVGNTASSSATVGQMRFVTGAHTAGQGDAGPFTALSAAAITFKANMTSGSPYLTAVASQIAINTVLGGITDLMVGMTFTGPAGTPPTALIATIDQQGGVYRIGMGTDTTGNLFTSQNATGASTQGTFTITSHVQALCYWPTVTNAT